MLKNEPSVRWGLAQRLAQHNHNHEHLLRVYSDPGTTNSLHIGWLSVINMIINSL